MANRLRKKHLLFLMLNCAFGGHNTATAHGLAEENVRLSTLIRELNAIERIATAGDTVLDLNTSRYHFNYTRLRADIHRVRSGIQQYLSPQRASPRDEVALHANYRDETVSAE
ncbi:RAQPRD family integrative conjugative element protein [Pseudomonas sp. lyk4-40-TSB-59a]|jgi:RAQPRD family integrative conjugative element protein|uniref:integrative conjugative element protein, RAQPRD family n=1 Tax=Pseudomonas sp. lyk4-40-TSB-59a TaxID=3040314 RepID=UPI002553BD37|nr:RAQPRD family integrative conjugative element protein [Pseudomonas sp. lyk4-40-TSB-59a]